MLISLLYSVTNDSTFTSGEELHTLNIPISTHSVFCLLQSPILTQKHIASLKLATFLNFGSSPTTPISYTAIFSQASIGPGPVDIFSFKSRQFLLHSFFSLFLCLVTMNQTSSSYVNGSNVMMTPTVSPDTKMRSWFFMLLGHFFKLPFAWNWNTWTSMKTPSGTTLRFFTRR